MKGFPCVIVLIVDGFILNSKAGCYRVVASCILWWVVVWPASHFPHCPFMLGLKGQEARASWVD